MPVRGINKTSSRRLWFRERKESKGVRPALALCCLMNDISCQYLVEPLPGAASPCSSRSVLFILASCYHLFLALPVDKGRAIMANSMEGAREKELMMLKTTVAGGSLFASLTIEQLWSIGGADSGEPTTTMAERIDFPPCGSPVFRLCPSAGSPALPFPPPPDTH